MVTVLGLGFVGLTTALGFADKGIKVYGFDQNIKRFNNLKAGLIDFEEPYLNDILARQLGKNFILEESLGNALKESQLIFLCVGTPSKEDGSVDLCYIQSAIEDIAKASLDDNKHTIVIKSTVPPGTCKSFVEPLVKSKGLNELIASNPEFLREGFCWEDFTNPGKIIIGTSDKEAEKQLRELYKSFNAPVFSMTTNEAEFSKYLSNVMLSSLISMSNEFAKAADSFGDINVKKVFSALHEDKRLKGSGIASYIYPGCGFGGYCLPKDTRAFYAALKHTGYDSNFIKDILEINNQAPNLLLKNVIENTEKDDPIGILGLSFKPDSDDVRETPSKTIIQQLFDYGYRSIYAFDPLAMTNFKRAYPDFPVVYVDSVNSLLEKCKYLILATAWNQFLELDFSNHKVFDGRYVL